MSFFESAIGLSWMAYLFTSLTQIMQWLSIAIQSPGACPVSEFAHPAISGQALLVSRAHRTGD